MIEICESVRLFLAWLELTFSKTARVEDSSCSCRSSSSVPSSSSRSIRETLVFSSSISFRMSSSSLSIARAAGFAVGLWVSLVTSLVHGETRNRNRSSATAIEGS
uniref:(northern house mosquito) hypothetical protein n=1 Tax=Culex pipiens TaxID=7175 RepID=A0A8D8FZB2_CULPI